MDRITQAAVSSGRNPETVVKPYLLKQLRKLLRPELTFLVRIIFRKPETNLMISPHILYPGI